MGKKVERKLSVLREMSRGNWMHHMFPPNKKEGNYVEKSIEKHSRNRKQNGLNKRRAMLERRGVWKKSTALSGNGGKETVYAAKPAYDVAAAEKRKLFWERVQKKRDEIAK